MFPQLLMHKIQTENCPRFPGAASWWCRAPAARRREGKQRHWQMHDPSPLVTDSDNDNDHSFSQLPVHKPLTWPEGQIPGSLLGLHRDAKKKHAPNIS